MLDGLPWPWLRFSRACGGGGSGDSSSSSASSGTVSLVAAPQASSQISQALQSGDASALTDAKLVAQHAQYAQQQIRLTQAARISSLYQGVSTEYDPTQWSYWVQPRNTATAQPLIVGDQGKRLGQYQCGGWRPQRWLWCAGAFQVQCQ